MLVVSEFCIKLFSFGVLLIRLMVLLVELWLE